MNHLQKLHNFLPWWIRYPIAVIGFIIGMYVGIEAWVIEKANTVVTPVRAEIRHIKDTQTFHYKSLNDNMNEIKQQQSIMYAEMLKRNRE